MQTYSVYIHTSPSGKVYIGITKRIPKYRWGKEGRGYIGNVHFYNAIQKYGWNSFTHEVLYSNLTKEEAQEIEIALILHYKASNPEFGYNRSLGGEAGFFNKDAYGEEYHKQYREEHHDKIIAYLRKYYRDNKEKAAIANKEYYEAHSQKIKEQKHRYYQMHKEEIIAKKKAARALKKLIKNEAI